mmetsp:Transcript_2978/g.8243  ORF Transcript_2978/g.8243 Transcript_2978/m.8243 type:complete len:300 (+) Transcript_2978:168-1067(+)
MSARPPVPGKLGSVLSPRRSGRLEARCSSSSKPPLRQDNSSTRGSAVDPADVLSHSDDEYEPEKLSDASDDELLQKKRQGPLPRGNSAIFFRPFNPDASSVAATEPNKVGSSDTGGQEEEATVLNLSSGGDLFIDTETFDHSISLSDRVREGLEKSDAVRKKEAHPLAAEEATPPRVIRVQSTNSAAVDGKLPNLRKSLNGTAMKKRESLQNAMSASSRGSRQTSRAGSVKASTNPSRFTSSDRPVSMKTLDTSFRKSTRNAAPDSAAQGGAVTDDLFADNDSGLKKRSVSSWLKKHFK